MKYFLAALAIMIGLAGIVYGGADDSPGLQFISAMLVIGTIIFSVKTVRARHSK